MNLIKRDRCIINNIGDLELLYSFKDFPISMGCTDTPPENDIRIDMKWWISKSTGCIQLNPLIPMDILYKTPHGAGSVGGIWKQHHKKFAEFIKEFNIRSVLEIGAGHGKLLNYFENVDWTVIDPNPQIESTENVNVIKGFFNINNLEKKYETVIHSQLLEHIYEPDKFIKDIVNILEPSGMHFFAVPNMKEMLNRKYTNVLNFEHTTFLTEELIEYLLNKNGFKILKKEYFLDAHSIFYATIKTDIMKPILVNQYKENKKIFMNFIEYHKKYIKKLNKKISEFDGKVYLFGAHIFSQYLINFGLDIEGMACILDNDANKQEKRLYGSPLTVKSPNILKNKNNFAVILKTSMYNEEIKKDILENINDKVMFWE